MVKKSKKTADNALLEHSIKTPFLMASQETSCTLMLADITGFSRISEQYTNFEVTEFLMRFHAEMEQIVYDQPGAEIKHESGDSFWVFVQDKERAEEIGSKLVKAYQVFVTGFEDLPDIGQTSLRYSFMPAKVIAFEVGGERHYNSKEHVLLRRIIEEPH